MRMRKKKNGLERFNALCPIIIHNSDNLYNNPKDPFFSDMDFKLEIGCGKGDFIIGMSERDSECNYYAMEKITDVIIIAAEKYAERKKLGERDRSGKLIVSHTYLSGSESEANKEKFGNVRFINADATNLEAYFPENLFSVIFLNFSDPWRKKGYAKRRLTYIDFLNKYSKLLKNEGELRVKTDNDALFDFSIEQIEKSNFETVWQTRDLHNSDKADTNIMTEYERYFSEQGVKINSLIAVNKK